MDKKRSAIEEFREETDAKVEEKLARLDLKRTKKIERNIRIGTLIFLIALGVFLYVGYKNKWFTSPEPLTDFFVALGPFGFLVASALVILNTMFPVVPGALPSIAMFMAYGNLWGFIFVMIMTLVGSCISFSVSRKFGATFVKAFVPEDIFNSLMAKITNEKTAMKLAAIAFIVPGLPDDATVMICGLTEMRFSRFLMVCLIFKPIPTFLYLFGFSSLLHFLFSWITHP